MRSNNRSTSIKTLSEEFAIRVKQDQRRQRLTQIMPVVILIALFILFTIALPNVFLTWYNMKIMMNQLAITLMVAVGITFVILTGSLDLSIEGVLALGGCLFSVLVLNSKNSMNLGIVGLLIALLTGVVCGFISGFVHVKLKVTSFMVTYATLAITLGFALLTYKGHFATIQDKGLLMISTTSFLGIPTITWIAFALFFIAWLIQSKTRFGRYMYAVGTNESIPRMTGVNVDRVKIMVFMWSGLCIALAGVISSLRLGYGIIDIGYNQFFPAQAAVVVGGTALSGGRGGVVNTLVGAMIITVIEVGLLLLGVNAYIRTGLQGAIIVVAVILTVTKDRRSICK